MNKSTAFVKYIILVYIFLSDSHLVISTYNWKYLTRNNHSYGTKSNRKSYLQYKDCDNNLGLYLYRRCKHKILLVYWILVRPDYNCMHTFNLIIDIKNTIHITKGEWNSVQCKYPSKSLRFTNCLYIYMFENRLS